MKPPRIGASGRWRTGADELGLGIDDQKGSKIAVG